MTQIPPVILCGGSGTRLLPLSRESYPKQFVPLTGTTSAFQASALRVHDGGDGLDFARPIVLTRNEFRFIVAEQLLSVCIEPGAILIEPEGRNTGPAVLAAALRAHDADPEAILLVLPSDHIIPDAQAFRSVVSRGVPAVAAGDLVTLGVAPDRAETGYGYLELTACPDGRGAPVKLKRFVEKPEAASAEVMLAGGQDLWNAGIFLFAAKDMLAAFDTHAPDLVAPVRAALDEAESDLGFCRIAPRPWAEVRNVSIDYAVMEKVADLSVVPFTGAWSDLGSWEAVLRESTPDAAGVATSGEATAIDCRNCLLRSENEDLELLGLGLEGIVAVATPDAVLVADVSRAQDVRLAVDALRRKGAKQATDFPRDHRPWGFFETLALADRFQVKRIVVKPGAALSLQSHVHRSEHWIVVSGTAKVTVDDKVTLVTENESIYVPLGAVHRMENPGKVPMVLIEVQTGAYLGEDDIVRYEDIHARGQGAKG